MSTNQLEDEFANIPDDFEGVDFDAIPALAPPATESATPAANMLPVEKSGSDTSSPPYSCDDHYDAAFLAEVDALENSLQPAGGFCLLRVRKCSIDVVFSTRNIYFHLRSTFSIFFRYDSSSHDTQFFYFSFRCLVETHSPSKGKAPSSGLSDLPADVGTSTRPAKASDAAQGEALQRYTSYKRRQSGTPPKPSIKKGKMRSEDVKGVLEGIGDEMTCPM